MPKDGLEENEVKLDGQGKPLWLCLEMTIYFVVPDYHDKFPKACMNGWGAIHLTIAPDGTAMPRQEARIIKEAAMTG